MCLPAEMLMEKQQQQVKYGSGTVFATARMICDFDKLGLPWMIENPLLSRLWHMPEVKALINQSNVEFVKTHMC